jgi:hypothetical protein
VAEQRGVERTLRGLADAIRTDVAAPAPSGVRVQGDHRRRVRRASTALVAAASSLAIVFCGAYLARGGALPFTSAAATPTPSTSAAATPTRSATGSSPRPTHSVGPWPVAPAVDPIARVDWSEATILLPAHPGCLSGDVRFRGRLAGDRPRVALDTDRIEYGDLTGDGRPEAVLGGACLASNEDSGDGQGQLLVVTRVGDRLVALGWVGPRGGLYPGFWVRDRALYADVHPMYADWRYRLGRIAAYRWRGSAFASVDVDAVLLPLTAATGPGPEVDLRPVADAMGCPAATLQFGPDGTVDAAGARWDLQQPAAPDDLAHWVDLDGTGHRSLLVAITCDRPTGAPANWVTAAVVLQRAGDGYRALDAVRPPDRMQLARWAYARGILTLSVAPVDGGLVLDQAYTWNGSYFQR